MVFKYSVRDTQIFTDVDDVDSKALMRTSTLSVPSKTQRNIAKSLDPRFANEEMFRALSSSNNLINETYLNLTLDKIIEFSDDNRKLKSYIKYHSPYLGMGALDVFFINLKVGPTEKIMTEHIIFLNDLLTKWKNDIYVMPVVQFEGRDRFDNMELYSNFVSRMIHYKNSNTSGNLNLGVSIPPFYFDDDLSELSKLYSDENAEPTFVSVDFSHAGMDNPDRMAVVDAVNKHYEAEGVENYFLYGFNVRAYKRKQATPISDEMIVARSGLNAVGVAHYPGGGPPKPVTQLYQLGVVFDREDYHFHHLDEKKHLDSFLDWSLENGYNFDIHNNLTGDAENIKKIMKGYNFYKENEEFFDISYAIRKNDKPLLKDILGKGYEPPPVKRVLDPSQRTLDIF